MIFCTRKDRRVAAIFSSRAKGKATEAESGELRTKSSKKVLSKDSCSDRVKEKNTSVESDWKYGVFQQPTHCSMAVRLEVRCVSPAHTVQHGSQTGSTVHFASPHSAAWQSDWKLVRP